MSASAAALVLGPSGSSSLPNLEALYSLLAAICVDLASSSSYAAALSSLLAWMVVAGVRS